MLAAEAGEEVGEGMTKAAASLKIDELRGNLSRISGPRRLEDRRGAGDSDADLV